MKNEYTTEKEFLKTLISEIYVNDSNLNHIAKTGKINGSLFLGIMDTFYKYRAYLIEQGNVFDRDSLLRMTEDTYRRGLRDAKDLNGNISALLISSQITAFQILKSQIRGEIEISDLESENARLKAALQEIVNLDNTWSDRPGRMERIASEAINSKTCNRTENPVINTPERNGSIEPSMPDHNGERVITWNFMEKRDKPNKHLHFRWDCPYCGCRNEFNTTIPTGLAEVVCENGNCEAFMYLEKIPDKALNPNSKEE